MDGVVSAPCCDFCNNTTARWALRCDDVGVLASGAHATAVAALTGAWNACGDCLLFVQRADSDGLADRVARSAHGPPEVVRMTTTAFRSDVFKALYKRVLPWLGSPQPLATVGANSPQVEGEP
jgi:hypothetical protein